MNMINSIEVHVKQKQLIGKQMFKDKAPNFSKNIIN